MFFKGAGPAVNEALSNKQIDFAYQGDLPQVVGRANGLKTKLLVASGVRNNLYLVALVASPLSSIKDIRDHKVSIFRAPTAIWSPSTCWPPTACPSATSRAST